METRAFYNLINNHVIEVPIIQREYAQGRTTDRVKSIRKRFVRDLINCVRKNEIMHLGFVYGKVEGKDNQRRKQINRDALNSILQAVKTYADSLELKIDPNIKDDQVNNKDAQLKFIPLDGQQRLTTLYLLYWYLFLKGASSKANSWMHHFNYTNRKSTMDFLKSINQSENYKIIKKRHDKGIEIKSVIKEASFYLQKWDKDKTVLGILEMLSTIEKELENENNIDFKRLNLESLGFEFDFMDLDALNQTNELYVKMNSRGKQLSNYEHFKSWLQNEHEHRKKDNWFKKFWRNLDNKWLNFFWRRIDSDFNRLDDFYFNFLKNIALMHTMASYPEIPLDSFKELITLIRNDNTYKANNISYISFDKFYIKWNVSNDSNKIGKENEITKELFLFNEENLKFIENSFDLLLALEAKPGRYNFLEEVICSPFIENSITVFYFEKNEFTPSQPDAVFYYSFITLLNKNQAHGNEIINFRHWLRFTRNLIYNTNIQNPDNFYNALRQVNYLIKNQYDFVNKAIDGEIKNSFFDNTQFEEEIFKLKLINSDNSWYRPIVESENQNYFQGQIKFLLNFSKLNKDDCSLAVFEKYSKKAAVIFSEKIRNSDKHILQRVLLVEGDYLPEYKSNFLFCLANARGLRTRNENWRLFFKGEKVTLLKQLIDKFDNNEITEKSLLVHIENHIVNATYKKWDWKYLFLNYPKAISYCKYGFIKWYSEDDIRLLPGKIVGGKHAELRSYCFYLENKTLDSNIKPAFLPFKNFNYFFRQNSDAHPGCRLNGFHLNDKHYRLDIRYSKQYPKFELCFYHEVEFDDRKVDNLINKILVDQEFTYDDNYNHYYRDVSYLKVNYEIENLCLALKKLK